MHAQETVDRALTMASSGMSTSAIAREIGVARATVRDWRAGKVPRAAERDGIELWTVPGFAEAEYCHLLGLYLGDGCISHAPRTTVLRIFFDAAYPRLIADAVGDVRRVRPGAKVHVFRQVPTQCVVVGSMWKRWPELFPRDGPGRKHERPIFLADWQRALTARHPEPFIRGLLSSDGCRYVKSRHREGTRVRLSQLWLHERLGGHQGDPWRAPRSPGYRMATSERPQHRDDSAERGGAVG